MKNEDIINQFDDISPVQQFSDQVQILKIKYSKNDRKLLDIFRGVLVSKEI